MGVSGGGLGSDRLGGSRATPFLWDMKGDLGDSGGLGGSLGDGREDVGSHGVSKVGDEAREIVGLDGDRIITGEVEGEGRIELSRLILLGSFRIVVVGGEDWSSKSGIEFLGDLDLIFRGGLVARMRAEIVLDLERDLFSLWMGELGGEGDGEGAVRVLGSSIIG